MPVAAQQKITLEQIWGGAFRTQVMDDLQAMNNSNQYTVLNVNRTVGAVTLDLYDFATLSKVSTLIDSQNFRELENGIDSYILVRMRRKY